MMGYYSALKINELSGHEKTWRKHTYILLSEKKKSEKPSYYIVAAQSLSHIWLYNPMEHSMPGFPVLHYVPGFAQIHVHWVGDAIQSISSIYPPIRVFSNELTPASGAKVMEFQL